MRLQRRGTYVVKGPSSLNNNEQGHDEEPSTSLDHSDSGNEDSCFGEPAPITKQPVVIAEASPQSFSCSDSSSTTQEDADSGIKSIESPLSQQNEPVLIETSVTTRQMGRAPTTDETFQNTDQRYVI